MSTASPYDPPKSRIIEDRPKNERAEHVRSGQKLVIWAILLYFLASACSVMVQETQSVAILAIGGLFALIAILAVLGMSFTGIFRIWRGLETPVAARVMMLFLLLIPLIGLLTLVFINSRATRFLRAQGYRVGFLCASPP